MPVLTKINTNVIADNAITAAKIPTDAIGATDIAAGAVGSSELADDAVLPAKIAYLGDGTGTLSGTITGEQLRFGTAFTLTDDLTVNGDVTLGKVGDDSTGQSLTQNTSANRTITGTGTLRMGSSMSSVEGMTGALGSDVTIPAAGVTGTLGSGVTFPAGHVLQVTAMQPNRTSAVSTGSEVASACTHGITVTAGNDILVTATVPYRMVAPGSAPPYMAMSFLLKHSTDNSTFANVADGVMPTTGVPQRAYIDNSDGSNVNANLYLDDTLTWNWLDESVSGTVHYYKIYFTGHQGSNYVSYDEVYSTMTLTEIQS